MRLSVVQKVAIVLALLLALVGGIGLAVLDRASHLVNEVQLVARSHQVRASLAELLRKLSDAESAERGFLLARDSADLLAYRHARAAASDQLAALDQLVLVSNPRQRARLARLDPLVRSRLAELDSTMYPVEHTARPSHASARDSARVAQIRAVVGAMDIEAEDRLERRVRQARAGERLTLLIAGAGSLLAILVALFGVGVIRADLAERVRNTARVRASEARFRGAAEGSMDALFLLQSVRDDTGQIVDFAVAEMNTRAERLLGRPRGQVIGRRMGELYPVTREDGFLDRCARVVCSGTMIDEEISLRVPGMTASWLHQTIVRVGDGVAVTSRDVTAKRRVDERLRQAQKMEAVGRLANGVAHDFNNVLAAIRVSSDAMAMTMTPSDPRREDVSEITRAVDRAAQLTRQLLAFSRKQENRPVVVDLNLLVRGMEGLLRRLIARDVRLITSLDPGLGLVRVDEGQMEQVLLNLVVNARDAMPNGGTLEIATRNMDVDESRQHAHGTVDPGRYIALAVRDTGVGIDDKTMARLFEPFFTTKPDGKGTGLGLATSYGIVEQSGGHITVASEPGEGTEFTIFLPRENGLESRAHAPSAETSLRAPGPRGGDAPRPEAPPEGRGSATHVA